MCGNLVGLGNPLTNVSPSSGHALSEIVDLLVSVWALAITGAVVGLVGGIAAMQSTMDVINTTIVSAASGRSPFARQAEALEQATAGGASVDLATFKEIARTETPKASDAALEAAFRKADASGNGVLDRMEVDKMLSSMKAAGPEPMPVTSNSAIDRKLEELSAQIEANAQATARAMLELRKLVTENSELVTQLRDGRLGEPNLAQRLSQPLGTLKVVKRSKSRIKMTTADPPSGEHALPLVEMGVVTSPTKKGVGFAPEM